MKTTMKFLWTMLVTMILACAGAEEMNPVITDGILDDGTANYDSDEVDLGQASEALTANCASPSHYGVDGSNIDWLKEPCDVNKAGADCVFSYLIAPSAQQVSIYPYTILMRNGWSSGERTSLPTLAAPGGTYLDSQLGGDCTNLSGLAQKNFFKVFAQSNPDLFVNIDKGALPEPVNVNNNAQGFERFVHMACVQATPVSESFPMFRAQRCTKWAATVDYAKLFNWANTNCGSQCVNRAVRNMFQKIWIVGMSVGLNHINATTTVDANDIRKDIIQTGWSGSQVAWVCNYARAQDTSNTLNCVQ